VDNNTDDIHNRNTGSDNGNTVCSNADARSKF
jgi:hypothetical protein